ncbi:hypothetical protein O6H91_16G026900 [Diphasiastrum complanatum]|uniref:Uncharacterized protein n=1 Tax=Diphasiastrum complanatum TaxID=34168 RepID=A0ACC2BAS1_DIPCM|nr:hypothetical protein O6H91_16G026900 [Diphasiastrum complanatum]
MSVGEAGLRLMPLMDKGTCNRGFTCHHHPNVKPSWWAPDRCYWICSQAALLNGGKHVALTTSMVAWMLIPFSHSSSHKLESFGYFPFNLKVRAWALARVVPSN